MTLTQQAQRALAAYTFIECDHPLWLAWSDYEYAKATRRGVRCAAARLRRELRVERMVAGVMEAA